MFSVARVPATEQALLESVPDVVYRYRLRTARAFEYVSPGSTDRPPGRHARLARRRPASGSRLRLPDPLPAHRRRVLPAARRAHARVIGVSGPWTGVTAVAQGVRPGTPGA